MLYYVVFLVAKVALRLESCDVLRSCHERQICELSWDGYSMSILKSVQNVRLWGFYFSLLPSFRQAVLHSTSIWLDHETFHSFPNLHRVSFIQQVWCVLDLPMREGKLFLWKKKHEVVQSKNGANTSCNVRCNTSLLTLYNFTQLDCRNLVSCSLWNFHLHDRQCKLHYWQVSIDEIAPR